MRWYPIAIGAMGAVLLLIAYALVPVVLEPATPDYPIAHAVTELNDPILEIVRPVGLLGWILLIIGITFMPAARLSRIVGVTAAVATVLFSVDTLLATVPYGLGIGISLAYIRPPRGKTIAVLTAAWLLIAIVGSADQVVGQPFGGWRILASDLGRIAFFALVGFAFNSAMIARRPKPAPSGVSPRPE